MSDNHQINLNINAAGAKRGASEYKAAIDQITAATKAYKTALDQLGGNKNKVDFSKMAKELSALSNLRINSSLSTNINALGAAMRNFRGPTANQLKSTRDFLRTVAQAQVNPSVARNVAAISQAFSSFRGPTRNNAAAVKELFRALNGARITPSTATQLAAITSSLSQFRGPSAASVRNIDQLVNSINRLRNPPNLSALSHALNAIAASGSRASSTTQRLTQTQQASTAAMQRSSSAALRLTGDMRGLENAFSLSYQMGSQLRVLFGSLTFSEFTRGVYNSTLAVQRFQTTMGVTSANLSDVQSQMNFASGVADKYGISIAGVYDEYGRFATAAKLAGQSTENVKYIFESVSSAMRVMGTDTMGQQRVFRALTQMFSKGAVRAEELVQQLGEQIPGAFQVMQDALSEHLGKPVDLAKMLELGQVDDSAVVLFAEKLGSIFGPKVAEAMERADSWIGRLQNSWFKFQALVGQNGVQDALGDVARKLSELMDSADFQSNAVRLAKALGDGIRMLGEGAAWAITHVRELGTVLLAMLTGSAVSSIARVAGALGSLATAGGAAGLAFAAIPASVGAAVAALTYYWDETLKIGEASATVGTIATQAWTDVKNYILGAMDSADGFSLQGIIDWVFLADTTSAKGFTNMARNGELTADKFRTLFGNAAQVIGAEVTKIFLQMGVGINKLIATAARNMDYYTKSIFQPWKSEETLLSEYNATLESDFAVLNHTLDRGSAAIDDFFGVNEAKAESWDILKPVVEKYAERAANLEEARAQMRRQEEADRKAREAARAKEAGNAIGARPEGDIDPLKNGSAGGKDSVSKRLKDAEKATTNYRMEVDALNQALQAGQITLNQYNQGLEYQARKLQETADPYAAMVRTLQDETGIQNMATRARNIEIAHREKINELAEKGVHVTAAQSEKLRQLIATQQQMSNRPLKDWVDGIEEVGVATDRVAVSAMEGLSDQIADLVVTGKADFASLAQSILKDFIKVGINNLYKDVFAKFGGSQEAPEQKNVSTSATGVWDAAQKHLGSKTQDWEMRGSFGDKGDKGIFERYQAEQAVERSTTQLKGTIDHITRSFDGAGNAVNAATPQIDTMTTGAINAAKALNDLAAAAGGAPNQPFPGGKVPGATATATPGQTAWAQATDPMTVQSSPARMAATPYNGASRTLSLTPQEVKDLKKTLMTEVDAGLQGPTYDAQAAGVVDTILNRKVSGKWGGSVTDVVNAKSQFSDINGPVAWKAGRGGVEYLSDSLLESGRGARASKFVDDYLAKRSSGAPSSVGGNLHYANPNYSDAKNMEWINKLNGPTLGSGKAIHKHGTTAGFNPVDAGYQVEVLGEPKTNVQSLPGLNWDGRKMSDVKGLTFHHTGGRGKPQDVVNTLNQRGLGAQYIMDRDGTVYQTAPDGARLSHMKNAQNGSGLSNANTLGIEMIAKDNDDLTDAQKASGLRFIEEMKAKYPGIGENIYGHGELNAHKRADEGMGVVDLYRQQRDSGVNGQTSVAGIDQANQSLQTLGQTAQQVAQQTQQSAQQQQTAAQQKQGTAQQEVAFAQQAAVAHQQSGMAVMQSGVAAQSASPQFTQAGQAIASAGQQAAQGAQQALGQLGSIASMIPGAGPYVGMATQLMGLFKEGGLATQPVQTKKLPQFAEGTPNTGSYGRGGIPSILHPNEAVIPLSRGRKVPVEMNAPKEKESQSEFAASSRGGGNTFNLNLTGLKSADDFKRNQRQINARLASAQDRAARRNG